MEGKRGITSYKRFTSLIHTIPNTISCIGKRGTSLGKPRYPTIDAAHWANSNAGAGYQLGEEGNFPTLAILVWVS